jgi:hypothetical protein
MGRNPGRQWGDSVATYGEVSMAAVRGDPRLRERAAGGVASGRHLVETPRRALQRWPGGDMRYRRLVQILNQSSECSTPTDRWRPNRL